jgi:hypothetical protein
MFPAWIRNCIFTPNTIRVFRSRRMCCSYYVTRCGRGEVHRVFWRGDAKKWGHLEEVDIDGRTVLTSVGRAWIGFTWHWIGTPDGLLWTRWWTLGLESGAFLVFVRNASQCICQGTFCGCRNAQTHNRIHKTSPVATSLFYFCKTILNDLHVGSWGGWCLSPYVFRLTFCTH